MLRELAVAPRSRAAARPRRRAPSRSRPSFAASGMNGPSTSRSSAPTVGMLTAFVTRPPSSAATTCSATITPARSCASSVEAARCGVTTTFGARSSGPSYGSCDEDVDRRAGDLARLERGDERRFVDELAARSVDDPDAVAHLRDRVASSIDAACLVGQRQVQRQELRAREHLVERRALDSELTEPLGRDERVVGDHLHLQAERAARDLAADPAEPEHAEHLVGELDPAPLRPLPAPCDERRMCLRDVARQRDEQPDRVLCRRDDVRLGRVRDDDPAPRRRVDVDVVDAHAGAPDHLQVRRRARSCRRSPSSPSGRSARRSRRRSLRAASPCRRRRRTSRAAARPRHPRSSRERGPSRGDGGSNASNAFGTATPARSPRRARSATARPPRARSRCRRRRTSRCARSGRSSPSGAPARRERDPCRSRRWSSSSSESIPSGARTAVTTAAPSSSGENSSRPIALTPRARAAEADVARERGLEAVGEDQPERDIEAADQRDGRA